jgi:hypothetical protein
MRGQSFEERGAEPRNKLGKNLKRVESDDSKDETITVRFEIYFYTE